MINVILLLNLIIAQLAYAYKKVNKDRHVHWLLQTLSVREVSEADDKYSAVISAPFPISVLNLLIGSIVLAAKSPKLNELVLHLYFLPVLVGSFICFIIYQVAIIPMVYVKMIFHKWALLVKAPKGMGSASFFDRAGKAIIFMLFGPLVLVLNALVDIVWFLIHIYKKDLDKTVTKQKGKQDADVLPEIHRRTYKKIQEYFEKQNDQLVLQKKIAEDLRSFLDVDEGIRCMIYGKPIKIKADKADFYIAYMHQELEPKTAENQLDSM